MKLQELAQKLDCRLEGNPSLEITGVAGIDRAQSGEATFLANRRYSPQLKTTQA